MLPRGTAQLGSFGPDELSTLYTAFDGAWKVMRKEYNSAHPVSTDMGRLRLANAILSAHRNGLADAENIKAAALRMMGIWQ